jgi:dTMP kinase
MPALTFLLDMPVSEGLRRVQQRQSGTKGPDRFEAESVAFHERVRAGYLAVARSDPQRVCIVDAARPVEVIHRNILTVVQGRLLGFRKT